MKKASGAGTPEARSRSLLILTFSPLGSWFLVWLSDEDVRNLAVECLTDQVKMLKVDRVFDVIVPVADS